jgi:hypothetical protein
MKLIAAGALTLALTVNIAQPRQALAWGDDGHKVVALIAQHYLTQAAKTQIDAMLAADDDPLTPHDFASEATWADKYRDANIDDSRQRTSQWHFVDIEIAAPDLDQACFNHPSVPSGAVASNGPDADCVVDKIVEFAAELAAPRTDAEERLVALKFLLHFVGDMHQPLHSSDNHDRGGNEVRVIVDGFAHEARDNLHGYWDTQFVDALVSHVAANARPATLANKLLAEITSDQVSEWQKGTPKDWAMEAFKVSISDAYGDPPLSKTATQHLDSTYAARAEKDIAQQLSKAGVRLAFVLNEALQKQ